jgi:DNA-binding transcriptional LysR family regulator
VILLALTYSLFRKLIVTLKQLEAFYWAATCVNFAVAAERTNLSVSSLSKRITELEQSLGKSLFNRDGHKAVLSDAGQVLLPKAKQLLEDAAAVKAAISENQVLSGNCKFGSGELSGLTWITKFTQALQDEYPTLNIDAEIGVGAPLEEKVEKGELDFIVIAGPSSKTKLASSIIGKASFVWVCSTGISTSLSKDPSTFFENQKIVTLPISSGAMRMLDDWIVKTGISPKSRMTCNSWGTIAALIVQGMGFGFLPKAWAENLASKGQLKIIKGWEPLADLSITYQWRRDDSRPLISESRRLAAKLIDFGSLPEFS